MSSIKNPRTHISFKKTSFSCVVIDVSLYLDTLWQWFESNERRLCLERKNHQKNVKNDVVVTGYCCSKSKYWLKSDLIDGVICVDSGVVVCCISAGAFEVGGKLTLRDVIGHVWTVFGVTLEELSVTETPTIAAQCLMFIDGYLVFMRTLPAGLRKALMTSYAEQEADRYPSRMSEDVVMELKKYR